MGLLEDRTQVFIVRIWLVRHDMNHLPAEWRGVIEHVQSGERRYFKNLGDAPGFIEPYLTQMGVKFSLGWRLKRWLKWRLPR